MKEFPNDENEEEGESHAPSRVRLCWQAEVPQTADSHSFHTRSAGVPVCMHVPLPTSSGFLSEKDGSINGADVIFQNSTLSSLRSEPLSLVGGLISQRRRQWQPEGGQCSRFFGEEKL